MNSTFFQKLIKNCESFPVFTRKPLILTAILLLTFVINACDDSVSNMEEQDLAGVLVINEGNWADGNGSITILDPSTGEIVQERFQAANGRPLGGIIQSATLADDRLYLVLNNTNKIEVADPVTLESIATIEAGSEFTPAGFVAVNQTKGYVSNLYDNAVNVVDLEENIITDTRIGTGYNPQEMLIFGSLLYVLNNGFGLDNSISIIDTGTDETTASVEVGAGPLQIYPDSEGRLWVMSSGYEAYDENRERDPDNDIPGRIDILDAADGGHPAVIETGGFPRGMAFDEGSARAWVVNRDAVQQIDMNQYELLNHTHIARAFNGIGYSEAEELFYLALSRGYTQSGQAVIFNPDGEPVDSFTTGIAPRDFIFLPE